MKTFVKPGGRWWNTSFKINLRLTTHIPINVLQNFFQIIRSVITQVRSGLGLISNVKCVLTSD